ncbi:MAG: hypothetical protein L6Q60_04915 [Rhodocyclaceae bacterium]|nr:hypothetical protein [Rhodocyclaceae bacterium]
MTQIKGGIEAAPDNLALRMPKQCAQVFACLWSGSPPSVVLRPHPPDTAMHDMTENRNPTSRLQ